MKIELKGYNIDNLLKTLYVKKIRLFNVKRVDYGQVVFEVLDKDYKKVKRYIANYKVKQTFGKLRNLPKFILERLGVVIGCFFGLIFGLFASNYTWQIKIFGTEELTCNEILQVLEENGVKKGKINHQSNKEIENILLNNYDRIAQVSVIKEGTTIIINLSEKLVYEEGEFQPIVAKYNGIIKDIKIVTGTTNIKVGDYVNVGDVLVLPFNINSNGDKVAVNPMAEITAEIFHVSKCELNRQEYVLKRTGREKKKYNYKFKNKKLFSSNIKNSFALFEVVVYNENVSDIIPFNRDVCVFYELEKVLIEHDLESEKQSLIEKSKKIAYENLPVGKILNETVETCIVNDSLLAFTTIVLEGLIN